MEIKFTDKTSVKEVVRAMTLEEKALLITGGSSFGTASNERLGIPAALLIDAGGGVNLRQYLSNLLNTGVLHAQNGISGGMGTLSQLVYILDHMDQREKLSKEETQLLDDFLEYLKKLVPSGDMPSCFPVNSLLASSWEPQIVRACAEQVGKEASAFGVDVLLGTPCINIQRDPRGGRGFEGYSEDPYLISQMAPEYCLGVQEQGVIADLKHFAVNNQETERQTIDVQISERAMREIYLPGFQACVQKGKVRSVMTSYNWINGTASAHNKWLIEKVLREEWGFDGFVVSDWGGVYNQTAAVEAGNDLCMPGPRDVSPVVEAVRSGVLSEERLEAAVEHYLNVLADMPVMKGRKYYDIDSEKAKKVAYQAAASGIILLRNENQVLPLHETAQVSFYGSRCQRFAESGVGSGRVHTNKTSSLIESTTAIIGKERVNTDEVSKQTDAVVVTLFAAGQEGRDRENLKLAPEELQLFHLASADAKKVGAKLILILNIAGPVELDEILEETDAVLCVYFPGQEGAHAAADILFGRINPSGKLAQTFPHHLYDCPAFDNFPGENGKVYYGEGIYVGYRYYDRHHIEPLYPFGYGLSYTSFELSDLRFERERFYYDEEKEYPVRLKITNTGKCSGSETVQLYLTDLVSTLPKAEKELKGFQKVHLEPGESREIILHLNKEALSSFDEKLGKWVCEPGKFLVSVGTSSRDLPLKGEFLAVGENPYAYGPETEYTRLAADPRAVRILLEMLPEDIITLEDIKRQTVYIAFSFTFRDAYNAYVRPYLNSAKADRLFEEVCGELQKLDVTEQRYQYEEKEIY